MMSGTNVTLGATSESFGSGDGVLRILDANTNPTTAPTNGGLVYVDGDNLLFRDTSNVEHTLTSTTSVMNTASSTDNGVVRFDTTDGKVVQDTSTVLISDGGEVRVVGAEGYSFTSSTTSGVNSGGADTLSLISAGTTGLTITSSATTVEAAHVITGIDGSAGTPSFSFTSSPTTGLYLSGVNTLAGSCLGTRAVLVDGTSNVAFGTDTPDFAGGQGVVYFSDVTTVPTTTLSNGGILYVNSDELFFYDKDTGTRQVSGAGGLAGASTDNAIAIVTDTLGSQLGESGFILSSSQISGVDGSAGAPTYRVGTSGTVGWWYAGANVVEMGNGAAQLTLNSTSVTSAVQVHATTLRIGGGSGMTETFSSPTTTRNIADASGTFVWQQNGTPIFQTDTSENVDLLSHFALCTGATGNLSVGYDGTRFDIDVANAADDLAFTVGGTAMATCTSTGITCPNLVAPQFRAFRYGFTGVPNTGLSSNATMLIDNKVAIRANSGSRTLFFTNSGPSGNRSISFGPASTAPTSLPTSGVYIYNAPNNLFMRVTNKDVDVALNGPLARAKISRTQTIGTGAIDLIDTLVDVESNILVVDTAAPGTGTITGTADTAGWWEISGEAHWVSNATGFRRIRIKVGGVVVGDSTQNAVSGMETQQQVRVCLNVAASAVVTFEVEQNSGGNLDVDVIGTVVFMG
jgi:hypothetical protein